MKSSLELVLFKIESKGVVGEHYSSDYMRLPVKVLS